MFGIFVRKYPGLPELCTNLRQCQATHRTVEKYPEHRGWAQSLPFFVRVVATHKHTSKQTRSCAFEESRVWSETAQARDDQNQHSPLRGTRLTRGAGPRLPTTQEDDSLRQKIPNVTEVKLNIAKLTEKYCKYAQNHQNQ